MRRKLFALVIAAACGSPPVVEGALDNEPSYELSMEHAALADAAHILSRITARPAVFGARVDAVAQCVTISVHNEARVSAAEAVALVRSALADAGIGVELEADHLRFSVVDEGRLPECAPPPPSVVAQPAPPIEPLPPVESPAEGEWAAFARGVRQISESEVLVTRDALDALLADSARFLGSARVIPQEESGRVVAIALYGIRRASPLGLLGLQNGDRVRAINGYDMTAPSSALDAYAALRNADELAIELTRRGTPMVLRIRVVRALPE